MKEFRKWDEPHGSPLFTTGSSNKSQAAKISDDRTRTTPAFSMPFHAAAIEPLMPTPRDVSSITAT